MNRGETLLVLTVVPDSGTGQLVGLAGKMAITIVEKKHFYEFEYTCRRERIRGGDQGSEDAEHRRPAGRRAPSAERRQRQ